MFIHVNIVNMFLIIRKKEIMRLLDVDDIDFVIESSIVTDFVW